jgi:hypothetical protein
MKPCLEIFAAIFSLLGVIVGVRGTYLLTSWTHTYDWWNFTLSIAKMFWRKLICQEDKNKRVEKTSAILAKLNDENKAESLHGLEWVFLGFILQTVGAILTAIDAFWINFFIENASKAPK